MTIDVRRQAILECAARLFHHYGPTKTTVADIAREAQVGIGTVYLVFPSKEAIVEELSSSAHDRVLEAMRRVAEARSGDSFSERLAGVLESRVAMFLRFADEGQHACELVHCKSGPVRSVHARFRESERALLEAMFEQANEAGELASAVDAKRTAALVQRAYATLSPPWLYEEPAEDALRAAYEMCRLLLLGLVTRRYRPLEDERGRAPAPANTAPKRPKSRGR